MKPRLGAGGVRRIPRSRFKGPPAGSQAPGPSPNLELAPPDVHTPGTSRNAAGQERSGFGRPCTDRHGPAPASLQRARSRRGRLRGRRGSGQGYASEASSAVPGALSAPKVGFRRGSLTFPTLVVGRTCQRGQDRETQAVTCSRHPPPDPGSYRQSLHLALIACRRLIGHLSARPARPGASHRRIPPGPRIAARQGRSGGRGLGRSLGVQLRGLADRNVVPPTERRNCLFDEPRNVLVSKQAA